MAKRRSKEKFIRLSNARFNAIIARADAKYQRDYEREMDRHEARIKEIRAIMDTAHAKARKEVDRLEAEWWDSLTEQEREFERQTWKSGATTPKETA